MKENIKQVIREHALEELPNECCGLLVDDEHGEVQVFKCRNSSEFNRKEHFSISPEEYLVATTLGKISAIYHSHPITYEKAQFSEFDKKVSQNNNIKSILYDITQNEFLEHSPK